MYSQTQTVRTAHCLFEKGDRSIDQSSVRWQSHGFHFEHTCSHAWHGKVTTRFSLCRSAICFLNFAALRLSSLLQESCAVSEKLDMSCTKLAIGESARPHWSASHRASQSLPTLTMHACIRQCFQPALAVFRPRAFTSHPAFSSGVCLLLRLKFITTPIRCNNRKLLHVVFFYFKPL
jgi:hypothetical protein